MESGRNAAIWKNCHRPELNILFCISRKNKERERLRLSNAYSYRRFRKDAYAALGLAKGVEHKATILAADFNAQTITINITRDAEARVEA